MTHRSVIDPGRLTRTAFDILTQDLEARGNTLSAMHRAALYELLDAFTGYCTDQLGGRRAYPLPTGMGKTSAVVAFASALHRLGYRVPMSVAASRVRALSALKQDMLDHGIPEELIGLKHSAEAGEDLLPSTGDESRLIQMVTHARVRGGTDFALFGGFDGEPRPLTIYDETLLRADAFAFRARALRAAVAVLEVEHEPRAGDIGEHLLVYLQGAEQSIREALQRLDAEPEQRDNGMPVNLPALDPRAREAFGAVLARMSGRMRGFDEVLAAVLDMADCTLRVIRSEQGEGVVTAREAVPPELRNVVVLDASAPIRDLAKLDPTITVVESFDPAALKSFERVEVRHLVSPGGRSSVTQSLRAERSEASALGREVSSIIREGWESEEAFLLFTFVKRQGLDPAEELRKDLVRLGIDVHAKTAEGKPRINWLTWGQEASLNGYEFCTSVVMAGVLHRCHLDLAAAVRGQTGNPGEPTPSARIRDLVETEIAHCVFQGASRGSCRRVHLGQALPMRLWLIHRNPSIKTILDRVMPGAAWSYPEPEHLHKATADSKAAQMLVRLLAYLRGLPEEVQKVSSRAAKEALSLLPQDKASHHAFTRAGALMTMEDQGWTVQGRSLVRGAAVYGFEAGE